jgi:hypothetical protein
MQGIQKKEKKKKGNAQKNIIPMVVTSYSHAAMTTKQRLFNLLQTKRKQKFPPKNTF